MVTRTAMFTAKLEGGSHKTQQRFKYVEEYRNIKKLKRWDKEGCQVTWRRGRVCQTSREERSARVWRAAPCSWSISPPAFDLKHDRGKSLCGNHQKTDGKRLQAADVAKVASCHRKNWLRQVHLERVKPDSSVRGKVNATLCQRSRRWILCRFQFYQDSDKSTSNRMKSCTLVWIWTPVAPICFILYKHKAKVFLFSN